MDTNVAGTQTHNADPLVSVRVITYNQIRYLAKCLESILAQRISFPFEIVLGEDCSDDGTRDLAISYAQEFPDIIRLITSESNVGGWQNAKRVRAASRGKYHALCEGDDYWIDPLKLQRQVDFLESHPDYSMCFHDALVIWEGKTTWPRYYCPKDLRETLTIDDVIARPCFIPTASIMLRADIALSIPEWDRTVWCPDLTLRLWAAHKGPFGYIDDLMAVRRRVATGMTSQVSASRLFEDTTYVLRSFDELTDGRYADAILARIRDVQREWREVRMKKRLGPSYLLFAPGKLVSRLREYAANSRW